MTEELLEESEKFLVRWKFDESEGLCRFDSSQILRNEGYYSHLLLLPSIFSRFTIPIYYDFPKWENRWECLVVVYTTVFHKFIPLPRFFKFRREPPLLNPSLVLFPEQSD